VARFPCSRRAQALPQAVGREAAREDFPRCDPCFSTFRGFGYGQDHAYLLGRDLRVYPCSIPGSASENFSLPDDDWIGLWDGEAYAAASARYRRRREPFRVLSEGVGVGGSFAKLESGKIRAAPQVVPRIRQSARDPYAARKGFCLNTRGMAMSRVISARDAHSST
jgi:hypothetical protein